MDTPTLINTIASPWARWSTIHIFVESKASWFEITDNLPQHEEFG